MTKKMLEDFIKVLKKRNLVLLIALIIVSCLLVGTVIFAFSEFETTTENTIEYDIEYNAENDLSDNSTISQVNDMSENKDSTVLIICISIVLCVLIICVLLGVILYGKSKHENKKNYEKESDDKKEE